ncbi:T9SS type A sorting domain-containing protein [bacterium SCSIO 12741]|nr:T9SS type A sorting domain-containing protein [bacterium SCSIO 12741]
MKNLIHVFLLSGILLLSGGSWNEISAQCTPGIGAVNVYGAQTWTAGSVPPLALTYGVIVNPGATLTIMSTTLPFQPGACIHVKEGGQLKLFYANLKSASSTALWKGIKVDGNTNLTGPVPTAVLASQSTIQQAVIGVDMQSSTVARAQKIVALKTDFMNNVLGVRLVNPAGPIRNNESRFEHCGFVTDLDASDMHIEAQFVNTVRVESSSFLEVGAAVNGIYAFSAYRCSGLRVTGTVNDPSSFRTRGGVRWHTVSKSSITHSLCVQNKFYAFDLNHCEDIQIHYNEIVDPQGYGVKLDHSHGYTVTNNRFEGNISDGSTGLIIAHTGNTAEMVSKNDFQHWVRGIHALAENPRLKFSCNTFSNNNYHIYAQQTVLGIAAMDPDQYGTNTLGLVDLFNKFNNAFLYDIYVTTPGGSIVYDYAVASGVSGAAPPTTVYGIGLPPAVMVGYCPTPDIPDLGTGGGGGATTMIDGLDDLNEDTRTYEEYVLSRANGAHPTDQFRQVDLAMYEGNWNKAADILRAIPSKCTLEEMDKELYENHMEVYGIAIRNAQKNGGFISLNNDEIAQMKVLHEQELQWSKSLSERDQQEWTPSQTFGGSFISEMKMSYDGALNSEELAQKQETDQFSLFPNPADDRLIISLNGSYDGPAQVVVMNLEGQVVFQDSFEGHRTQIDISEFPAGYYLCKVTQNGHQQTEKLIIR